MKTLVAALMAAMLVAACGGNETVSTPVDTTQPPPDQTTPTPKTCPTTCPTGQMCENEACVLDPMHPMNDPAVMAIVQQLPGMWEATTGTAPAREVQIKDNALRTFPIITDIPLDTLYIDDGKLNFFRPANPQGYSLRGTFDADAKRLVAQAMYEGSDFGGQVEIIKQ